MASPCPLLGFQSAEGSRRVYKTDNRTVELFRLFHQAEGLLSLPVTACRSCILNYLWSFFPFSWPMTVTGIP